MSQAELGGLLLPSVTSAADTQVSRNRSNRLAIRYLCLSYVLMSVANAGFFAQGAQVHTVPTDRANRVSGPVSGAGTQLVAF